MQQQLNDTREYVKLLVKSDQISKLHAINLIRRIEGCGLLHAKATVQDWCES